jgi:anti-anti-sigma regulatory factor
MSLDRAVKKAEGKLVFCAICENISQVLTHTGLQCVFRVVADEEEALKEFVVA